MLLAKINIQITLLIFSVALNLSAHSEFMPNQAAVEKVSNGRQVVVKQKIDGAPWPEITVYDSIEAQPAEVMAVFSYYPLQKRYIPNLLMAKPGKQLSPFETHVSFVMNLPFPLANSKYVTGNKIKKGKDGSFSVTWYQVSSSSSKDSKGWIRFIPFEGKTLVIYKSFVHPRSSLAKMFKKKAAKEVIGTVLALKAYVEKINRSNQAFFSKYTAKLEAALQGKYIFRITANTR